MSRNKYLPHVLVLPEDEANRQIANGFILEPSINRGAIQVLPIVGGWEKVIEDFEKNHIAAMQRFSQRRIVLLIDFDRQEDRYSFIWSRVPSDLKDRVFILGTFSEPEELKRLQSELRGGLERINSNGLEKRLLEIVQRIRMSCGDTTSSSPISPN